MKIIDALRTVAESIKNWCQSKVNAALIDAKSYTDEQRLGYVEQHKIILGSEYSAERLDRDLIGLKVTDERNGRRFLATELDRPDASVYADNKYLYDIGGDLAFDIQYSDFNGLLSKECLVVGGKGLHFQCPAFFYNTFTTNEGLMYVFDETSDTMSLGITLKRGWYKVNQTTFDCEPIDLEKTPCFFLVDKKFNSEAAKAYLYEYSTPAKTSYTVKPENIYVHGVNSLVCNTDVSGIDPNSADRVQLALCWCSFMFSDGFVNSAISYPEIEDVNAVIEYETIHTIDPKFLPSASPFVTIETEGKTNNLGPLASAFPKGAETEGMISLDGFPDVLQKIEEAKNHGKGLIWHEKNFDIYGGASGDYFFMFQYAGGGSSWEFTTTYRSVIFNHLSLVITEMEGQTILVTSVEE